LVDRDVNQLVGGENILPLMWSWLAVVASVGLVTLYALDHGRELVHISITRSRAAHSDLPTDLLGRLPVTAVEQLAPSSALSATLFRRVPALTFSSSSRICGPLHLNLNQWVMRSLWSGIAHSTTTSTGGASFCGDWDFSPSLVYCRRLPTDLYDWPILRWLKPADDWLCTSPDVPVGYEIIRPVITCRRGWLHLCKLNYQLGLRSRAIVTVLLAIMCICTFVYISATILTIGRPVYFLLHVSAYYMTIFNITLLTLTILPPLHVHDYERHDGGHFICTADLAALTVLISFASFRKIYLYFARTTKQTSR
jgi:hypothetical protein